MGPFYCLHLTNDQRLSPRAARTRPLEPPVVLLLPEAGRCACGRSRPLSEAPTNRCDRAKNPKIASAEARVKALRYDPSGDSAPPLWLRNWYDRKIPFGPASPGPKSYPPLFPLEQLFPSNRPGAVQGAKRRSGPLTARTDLEIIRGEGKRDCRNERSCNTSTLAVFSRASVLRNRSFVRWWTVMPASRGPSSNGTKTLCFRLVPGAIRVPELRLAGL